ncbi:MAG: hypothetical protein ACJA0N_001941 [Pseudohongiellaceae bacterium]|jgi:hypothetical protein
MYRKMTAVFGAALMLCACSSEPTIQTGEDAEVVMGKLNKIDNSKSELVYIDPYADFTKYTKVMVMPLGVDNVEVIQPSSSGSMTNRNEWELTDSDKIKLQEVFHESMVKQLQEKGGYPVVTEAGDDVLQIVAKLTAIAPAAAKDDFKSRPIGRSSVYTQGGGGLAVAVVIGDSESGEVLGIMKDTKSSSSMWGSNNSVSNMSDVRQMFSSWAAQISRGLDHVHSK